MSGWLEKFWEDVLSREEKRIRAAVNGLADTEERQAVLNHLMAMATEPDWTESQRISARAALKALQIDIPSKGKTSE